MCVCSGALKNRQGQGEGVKYGYRTWSLITCAEWLALQRSRHLRYTQQKSTLRLYDNRASPVSWDPSIVMRGSWVEIFEFD